MKRTLITTLALLIALFACLPSIADTVHLKDGRVIEGIITRESDDFIFITYKIGDLERSEILLRSKIRSIDRDDTPSPDPAPAKPAPSPASAPKPQTSDASNSRIIASSEIPSTTRKLAFITLEEEVGPFMNAKALSKSVKLLEDDNPDIVVLRINSGGGSLSEIFKLSDVIEKEIKPNYRVVMWIESAISAAAMTAITCEEIYMMKEGNIGAATAYTYTRGRAKAIEGENLERIFRMMREISRRGNHNPLIMHAMEVPSDLSCDIDGNGKITWRDDLGGQYIVSTDSQILTFNSIDAVKYQLAKGAADNKDELAHMLGFDDWVEVGLDADAYQQEFRENVKQAQVRAGELLQKMNIALGAGNTGRARAFLGQLRGWVRRAPSLEEYGVPGAGIPPLTKEFFNEVEEKISDTAKKQQERRRR